MEREITLTLNGSVRTLRVRPTEKLLDVLREKFGLTAAKYGCGKGECGACTVLLDGKQVRSCLILAVEADGREVVTLEGFQTIDKIWIQETFAKHNAFQCGFCAPGMIVSTEELLRTNPAPRREEIQEALAGNLCRCTGYQNILDAVEEMVDALKAGRTA